MPIEDFICILLIWSFLSKPWVKFLSPLLDLLSKKKKKILEVGRWKKLTINDTQYGPQTLSVRDVYFHFIFRW